MNNNAENAFDPSSSPRSTPSTPSRLRVAAFAVIALACIGAAAGYAWWSAERRSGATKVTTAANFAATSASTPATETGLGGAPARAEAPMLALPASPPFVLMRSTGQGASYSKLAVEPLGPTSAPTSSAAGTPTRQISTSTSPSTSPSTCERVHAAAKRAICLEARRGVVTSYHAHLLDERLQPTASFDLAGTPSRTRLSADGKLAATTVFVSGHAYSAPGFSTRTSIIDAANGRMLIADLEALDVVRDGQPFKAPDFNFWGVTFKPDGKGFYATLQTGGKPYLVEADLAARRATVMAPDVECPSLSPDGRRLAFKRRVVPAPQGRVVWRLVVREIASGVETVLEREARSVDDQVEWIDDTTIAYALPDEQAPATMHTWALASDGQGAPRLWLPQASSPAVVR